MDLLMAIICFIMGLMFMLIFGWAFMKSLRTKKWLSVSGVITCSETNIRKNMKHQIIYAPHVKYEYSYAGRTYEGKDIGLIGRSERHAGYSENILKQFPVGRQIAVYLNPLAPKESVLQTNIEWIGLVAVLFGVGLMALSFFI